MGAGRHRAVRQGAGRAFRRRGHSCGLPQRPVRHDLSQQPFRGADLEARRWHSRRRHLQPLHRARDHRRRVRAERRQPAVRAGACGVACRHIAPGCAPGGVAAPQMRARIWQRRAQPSSACVTARRADPLRGPEGHQRGLQYPAQRHGSLYEHEYAMCLRGQLQAVPSAHVEPGRRLCRRQGLLPAQCEHQGRRRAAQQHSPAVH